MCVCVCVLACVKCMIILRVPDLKMARAILFALCRSALGDTSTIAKCGSLLLNEVVGHRLYVFKRLSLSFVTKIKESGGRDCQAAKLSRRRIEWRVRGGSFTSDGKTFCTPSSHPSVQIRACVFLFVWLVVHEYEQAFCAVCVHVWCVC